MIVISRQEMYLGTIIQSKNFLYVFSSESNILC